MKLAPGRQVSWGVADQALSSITNFAFSLMVARTAGTQRFGAFGIVFAAYVVLLGISRSITSEPLVVRHSASSVSDRQVATRAATGVAVLVGAILGLGCLAVGWALGGQLGSGLLALGIGLPGLLLQDTWRFGFFVDKEGRAAFINDLMWAIALVPALGMVLVTGRPSIFWLTLAWGGAASFAAAAGAVQARTTPWLLDSIVWLRRNWALWRCYSPESIAASGVGLAVVLVVGALTGLGGVGAIQAAGLLLGPLNVLFMAARLVVLPEFVRLVAKSPEKVQRASGVVTFLLGAVALIAGTLLLALPEAAGRVLLGSTWSSARTVLGPLVLMMASSGAVAGAELGLRALAAARRSLHSCLLSSTISVASAALGAWLGGGVGAAWGLAVGRILAVAVWWSHLTWAAKDQSKEPAPRSEMAETLTSL